MELTSLIVFIEVAATENTISPSGLPRHERGRARQPPFIDDADKSRFSRNLAEANRLWRNVYNASVFSIFAASVVGAIVSQGYRKADLFRFNIRHARKKFGVSD